MSEIIFRDILFELLRPYFCIITIIFHELYKMIREPLMNVLLIMLPVICIIFIFYNKDKIIYMYQNKYKLFIIIKKQLLNVVTSIKYICTNKQIFLDIPSCVTRSLASVTKIPSAIIKLIKLSDNVFQTNEMLFYAVFIAMLIVCSAINYIF